MSNKKNAQKKLKVSPNTFKGEREGTTPDTAPEQRSEEIQNSPPPRPRYTAETEDDNLSFMSSEEMKARPDLGGYYNHLTPEQQKEVRELYRVWLNKHHALTERDRNAFEVFDSPDWSGLMVRDEFSNPYLPITDTSARSQYDKIKEVFWESSGRSGIDCIDILEENGLVNSPSGFNSRHHIAGWLTALSVINEEQLASQASHELRVGVEETQFGASIADGLHTLALSIKSDVERMRTLDSHYQAVLMGRRLMGIEFQDKTGEFLQANTFVEKMNSPANNRFVKEQREKQDELRERMWNEEQAKHEAFSNELEDVIQNYGELVCDALDTEQDWS